MKYTLTALAVVTALIGCSSKPVTNGDDPIRNQKLSTSFDNFFFGPFRNKFFKLSN